MEPNVLVALMAIVATAALVNGFLGFGFALLAVNAMAFVLGTKEAILAMSLMAPVISGLQLIHHRHNLPPWRRLRGLVLGAVSGSLVGAQVLVLLPVPLLSMVLGVFSVAYVWSAARSERPFIPDRIQRRVAPLAGFVGGVSNGTLGASGPVFGSYLAATGLRGRDFAAAISALFFAMGMVRCWQLAALGQYDADLVATATILIGPSVAAQRLGFWLRRRVPTAFAYRAVLVLLALAGTSLIVRGAGQLVSMGRSM